MKIRKGDRVRVISGKDKGATGEVLFAFPAVEKVIIDTVNVAKRHTRPTGTTKQGGIIDKNLPFKACNVAILCSNCGPTKIGVRIDEQGRKVRICRKCGGDL
ncbi:MAG: 50S ribosomal protein L24 [Actinobacteria bacterium]|nr:50S ribosomal protein L24 [Actinomycetota bacterium]MCL6104677.1 50S ribosomal protein L24 [Actinomycetota bacterium]